ncbi:MAG: hypothetical protein LBU95_03785 [Rikenellaceae bacterium]|jgi:hypothetical protein|nr:hypothetical protein [Rikenellaceae bacterium]
MKKLIPLLTVIIIVLGLASCGKGLYTTSSQGQDNVSYVTVITLGNAFQGINVVVDGKVYPYGKVYTVKMKRKAQPVIIEPGKHHIKIVAGNQVLAEEDVLLGLQQTKQFVLR